MPAYIVTLAPTAAPLEENKLNVAVFAENVAAARLAASTAYYDAAQGGITDYWTDLFAAATVTEIVERADLEGAVLRVTLSAPTPVDVSVTGTSGDDLDQLGSAMVTALNADAQIAGAAYSGGNLLTVSNVGDNLGDKTVTATFTLDGVDYSADFIGTITHEGIAGADTSVQLATDAVALPTFVATF